MYVGSLDVEAGNQSRQRILATGVPAVFANGHLFFPRAGTLMAQPFDGRRMELHEAPVLVAQDVEITWYFTGVFSVSDEGVFVYRTASVPSTFQLTWVDRQGKSVGTFGPPGTDRGVVMSPDGRRAVAKDAPYNVPADLWMLDLASGRRIKARSDVKERALAGPRRPHDRRERTAGEAERHAIQRDNGAIALSVHLPYSVEADDFLGVENGGHAQGRPIVPMRALWIGESVNSDRLPRRSPAG